jgi:hypothetical protein
VDEVREQGVRRALAHASRGEVEVVVLEEHDGVGSVAQLVQDRVREAVVDCFVAVAPRAAEVRSRIVLQRPEAVLHEPEHRVGDHVVEELPGTRVVSDEAKPEGRAVRRLLVDRPGGSERALLVGHRAGDPRHVMTRD